MSLEEYHARQRANAAQNQAAVVGATLNERNAAVRRRLKRALDLLDREANPEAYREVEKALEELA
jgi:hypothetical protein